MVGTQVKHVDERGLDAAVAAGTALVDFWAPWCGPCRMMEPVLDELAEELGGAAAVVKVNVDEAPSLAARFRIAAIPLLVVLKDGREVRRLVGLQPKRALLSAVREAL